MGLRAVLGWVFSGDEPNVIVECRQCGANLSPATDACPECESEEIGRYRVSE